MLLRRSNRRNAITAVCWAVLAFLYCRNDGVRHGIHLDLLAGNDGGKVVVLDAVIGKPPNRLYVMPVSGVDRVFGPLDCRKPVDGAERNMQGIVVEGGI